MKRYGFDNGNGTSIEKGIRFLDYPVIHRGAEVIERKNMLGRKGTLTVKTGGHEDTEIENSLHIDYTPEAWEKKFASVRSWLLSSSKIIYTDNESVFYKVKVVEVGEPERKYGRWADFETTFICAPGEYLSEGTRRYSIFEASYNPYSSCAPVYYISGEGVCVLTVNGKTMSVNVGQDIVIDTDLMIAYKNDGTPQNIQVTGDYEDLILNHGENNISASTGFIVEIIPNWRIL